MDEGWLIHQKNSLDEQYWNLKDQLQEVEVARAALMNELKARNLNQ